MKSNFAYIAIVFFVLFTACSDHKNEKAEAGGLLYNSNGAMFFVPCNAKDKTFTIIDETGMLDAAYREMLSFYYPGEPVYVRLKGSVQAAAKKLFQTGDLDESFFTVEAVLQMAKRLDAPAECCYCDYSAVNTDWELEISQADEIISFRDNKQRQSFVFDYAEPDEEKGYLVYNAEGLLPGSIAIRIDNRIFTDRIHPEGYPVTIVLNDSLQYDGYVQTCY